MYHILVTLLGRTKMIKRLLIESSESIATPRMLNHALMILVPEMQEAKNSIVLVWTSVSERRS